MSQTNQERVPTRMIERELNRAVAAGAVASYGMIFVGERNRRRFLVIMPDGSMRRWEPSQVLAFCEGVTETLEAAQ